MADLSPTAANVRADTANGAAVSGAQCGATLTAGQAVYKDAANSSKLKLADNNDTDATSAMVGIMVNDSADNKPGDYITEGPLLGMGATQGEVYFLSSNAGGIAPDADITTGMRRVYIGIGRSDGGIDVKLHLTTTQVP